MICLKLPPFGMQLQGRTFQAGDYRYGFNGKENDNEVKGDGNQQDYGMRMYDPRLGKFLTVDPLGDAFAWNSPYCYAENDVIRSIDLEGLEKYIVTNYLDAQGKITRTIINVLSDKQVTGENGYVDLKMLDRKDKLRTTLKVLVRDVTTAGKTIHKGAGGLTEWQKQVIKQGDHRVLPNKRSEYGVYVGKRPDAASSDYLLGEYSGSESDRFTSQYNFEEWAMDVVKFAGTERGKSVANLSGLFVGIGQDNYTAPPSRQGRLYDVPENKDAISKLLTNIDAFVKASLLDPNTKVINIVITGYFDLNKISSADLRYQNFVTGLGRIADQYKKWLTDRGIDGKMIKIHTPVLQRPSTSHSEYTGTLEAK